jgi:SAM-dependent methyltransferase
MLLTDLVNLRNSLTSALKIETLREEVEKNCSQLTSLYECTIYERKSIILDLVDKHRLLINNFENHTNEIESIIEIIQEEINQHTKKFFTENYELELQYFEADKIRAIRILQHDENFHEIIRNRIRLYSSWQYPALEIGCRDGDWTKFLVASDPLYIADTCDEFLNSTVEQFHDAYKGRVLQYKITNNVISNLPSNQFGLIFSYNFFNYLSLDSIKQFLIQSFGWLRPGGKIIFTYNDADLPGAAGYADSYFMTYVPKSLLVPMAESVGFIVDYSLEYEPAFAVIELSKPGVLKSIRASQALGAITRKNN